MKTYLEILKYEQSLMTNEADPTKHWTGEENGAVSPRENSARTPKQWQFFKAWHENKTKEQEALHDRLKKEAEAEQSRCCIIM